MGDVTLLWFRCKNKDCNYIPNLTRKQKLRLIKEGLSEQSLARKRRFLRYDEGYYFHKGEHLYFHSTRYGDIPMWRGDSSLVNSADYPLEDKEECNICIQKIKNHGALFQ